MRQQISSRVIEKMMVRANEISRACPIACRDFRVMTSVMRPNTLILRWTTIDVRNPDKPFQQFGYECFNIDGSSQNCSVNYDSQEEANAFFASLKTHHQQTYSTQ